MPELWFGSDHVGNNTTTLFNGWISTTIARPVARTTMNGDRPFIVKKIAWKTCAAPSLGQKMNARISNADGSVYDNTFIGNTISYQSEAKVTYVFQATNMHFHEDGGGKIRAWLITGGPSYIARNTGAGGNFQSANGNFAGTPVGNVFWVQAALPPENVKVVRDAKDPNKTLITWKEWDIKNDVSQCGDSTSLSGYVVQIARDADFTKDVRLSYVSKGKAEVYGLYGAYDWYFRMATRNEVSEHYKDLTGGIWGDAIKLTGTVYVPPTPPADAGTPDGSTDGDDPDADTDNPGDAAGNNPGTSSGVGSGSTTTPPDDDPVDPGQTDGSGKVITGYTTVTTYVDQTQTQTVTDTSLQAARDQLSKYVSQGNTAVNAASQNPTAGAWSSVDQLMLAAAAQAKIIAKKVSGWDSIVTSFSTAHTAAAKATNTAAAAQNVEQQVHAAIVRTKAQVSAVYDAVVAAKKKSTRTNWQRVASALAVLADAESVASNLTTAAAAKPAWKAALKDAVKAGDLVTKAAVNLTAKNVEAGRAAAESARDSARVAYGLDATADPDYTSAISAVGAALDRAGDAVNDIDVTTTKTTTVKVPVVTQVPVYSDGSTGTPSGSTTTNPPTSGTGGSTPTTSTSSLAKVIARVTTTKADILTLQAALATAQSASTSDAWKAARTATNALKNDANYIVARSASTNYQDSWSAVLPAQVTAYALATTAAASGATAADDSAATVAINSLISVVGAAISSTPTAVGDDATGGAAPVVVYTPIPDTTANRTAKGGLLLSTEPRTAPGHTVYLMDRGGRQRLGQFKGFTSIQYNRIRDDQSTCHLVLDGTAVAKNKTVLDTLDVGRHEVVIYRGDTRVWEGPVTLVSWKRDKVEIDAKDITHYLNRTVMHSGYSNAYPANDFVVNRIAGIIAGELTRKEGLTPPVNILPYLHTYVEDGDAKTSRVTYPAEMTVWAHLDDLAAKAGLDYTVIGRALHIWDTSRAAMGRTRTVTELDFTGDTYISAYGMELATTSFVTDGQGNYGSAGGIDDYYGEVELVATAYDENQNPVDQTDTDTTNDTVPVEEMYDQAARNLKGRNPTPIGVHVPDGSGFRLDRGLGLDILNPGVFVPLSATLSGHTVNQMLKLKEIVVVQDSSGETCTVTLSPASDSDLEVEEGGDDS